MANAVRITFAGDTDDLQRGLRRANNGMDDFADKADKATDEATASFSEMGDKIETSAEAAGVAAGAALALGLHSAIEGEASSDKLAARLGLDPEEQERLGGIAGDLYAQAYGESLDEVNLAVESVYRGIEDMANASSDDLEEATRTALNFGTAFEIDVSRAAVSAGLAVKSGLADNATEAFDLMTAAAQQIAPDLREPVLDAADEYGQFFNALGIDGPQAFGILAESASRGEIVLDKMGDVLKEFQLRATDPANAEVFEQIGLDFQTMSDDILAGGDQANAAFDQIAQGLLNIPNSTDQANAAIALFGTPLEDLGKDQIPDFLAAMAAGSDAMGDFAGAGTELDDTLNDNVAVTFAELGRQIEMALVEKLNEALPTIESVGTWLIQYADYIVPIVAALAAFAIIVKTVTLATQLWTAAQLLLDIAMTANPIGLIIVAIAALVAAIIWIATQTTWFQDLWHYVWDKIDDPILSVWNWIKSHWPLLLAILTGPIGLATLYITRHADQIVGFFRRLPSRIRSATSGMWDGLKSAFRHAVNWVIGKWNDLSFKLPSITAFGHTIGGQTFSTPNIPYLHTGGVVPGAPGSEVPVIAQAGERVTPIRATPTTNEAAQVVLVLSSAGTGLDAALADVIVKAVRTNPAVRTAIRGAAA